MRPLPVTLPVSSVKGLPRPEPLRFVVFKGFEGFGDRLQCLLQALRYARGTGRLLVVDWRDDLWSHGAGLDFEDFMEIRGVKTFRVPEFLRVWSALRPQLRVHPASWATRLDEPTNADIYKVSLAFNSSWMWPIATHRKPDFEEEIVVYPGVRTRRSNYKDIRYLRLRRWLALEVRKRMRNEGLEAGKYGVVHLRGADKPWRCENLQRRRGERHQDRRASAVHLDHIAKRWPSEESYLVDLRRQLDRLATNFTADAHSTGPAGGFRMVVISDLPCLREAYPVLDANRNGPGREHGAGDGEDSYVVHPQVAEVDLPRHSCADDGHARACRASRLRRLWDESKPCASSSDRLIVAGCNANVEAAGHAGRKRRERRDPERRRGMRKWRQTERWSAGRGHVSGQESGGEPTPGQTRRLSEGWSGDEQRIQAAAAARHLKGETSRILVEKRREASKLREYSQRGWTTQRSSPVEALLIDRVDPPSTLLSARFALPP